MLVYISAIIICFFFGMITEKLEGRNSIVLKLVPMITLFIISAIRYNVGIDYSGTYTDVYYWVVSGFKNIRMDAGLLWLYRVIVFFGLNLQWIFVITSFIINLYIFKSIEKISSDKKLSYLIYICSTFYFFGMNGIRQAISMALFYFSLNYIPEKKWVKFIVTNLIGALFHETALLFIPLYYLILHRFKSKKTYIAIACAIFFATPFLVPIIVNVLKNTRYVLYFLNNNYSAMNSINLSAIINIIFCVLFIIKIDLKDKSKEGTLAFSFFICHYVGVILTAFMTSIPLILRIFESFRFIDFLSIPYLLKDYKGKNKLLIYIFVVIFYLAYFIYHIFLNNANGVLPYTTIFG